MLLSIETCLVMPITANSNSKGVNDGSDTLSVLAKPELGAHFALFRLRSFAALAVAMAHSG